MTFAGVSHAEAQPATHGISTLAQTTAARFVDTFGVSPRWMASAPGRVNVIGEHTDYNEGFVLPIAIDRQTIVAAAPLLQRGHLEIVSTEMGSVPWHVDECIDRLPKWARYIAGVIYLCADAGLEVPSISILVDSTVPTGGGLSSSAALEVATATLVEAVTGQQLDPVKKAELCREAEHRFADVPCGIMDQYISVMGQANTALLLDCQSLDTDFVPLDDSSVGFLIANTMVSHALGDSAYAERRRQCNEAAKILGLPSLRQATPNELDTIGQQCGEAVQRRAQHVVTEIARTIETAVAIRQRQWQRVGDLMSASHASLRDDYEVSCAELDLMVELTRRLGGPDVFGSRMTGGGFGGCTVSLVKRPMANALARSIAVAYAKETGIAPDVFVVRPSGGCRPLKIPAPKNSTPTQSDTGGKS